VTTEAERQVRLENSPKDDVAVMGSPPVPASQTVPAELTAIDILW
jgi:hypothetical protein